MFWDAPETMTTADLISLARHEWGDLLLAVGSMLGWLALFAVIAWALSWMRDDEVVPADDDADLAAIADAVAEEHPTGSVVVQDGPDVLLRPARPVNERRDSRWPTKNANRGDYFDEASRRANEANAEWITEQRQSELGRQLVDSTEQFLKAQAARQARWDAATTQEIKRGDPGE